MSPRPTRRLTLEAPVATPDGAGGFAESWTALGVHWAALSAAYGAETVTGGARTSRLRLRATLRWAPEGDPARPRPEQRFREGERVYEVLAVEEDAERRHVLCWLEERRPA